MKRILVVIVTAYMGNALEASAEKISGAHVQNELHYKTKKSENAPDEIIVEKIEICDPKEETRMPFYN
ncbi:hypothetical protein Bealeia1_00948 [Candidatus Bealeia paramacronuclearis]|uniref:Uncharacterized protein n=1 Tax=Candidatus Bealeia paramacronuclearis TaxID=1921001 RepID=A0ABZ2C535_9PROT|nr:hypothetical protein [Candidatus Bealeia paramacronuclearis]